MIFLKSSQSALEQWFSNVLVSGPTITLSNPNNSYICYINVKTLDFPDKTVVDNTKSEPEKLKLQ